MKAAVESILVGTISAMLSYRVLISPATIAAIAIRGKMPDAWFSGLIVWYMTFMVISVSTVIAAVAQISGANTPQNHNALLKVSTVAVI